MEDVEKAVEKPGNGENEAELLKNRLLVTLLLSATHVTKRALKDILRSLLLHLSIKRSA